MRANERVELLRDIFSASYDLHLCTYDAGLVELETTCDSEVYHYIFERSGCKENLFPINEKRAPLVISDMYGLVWIGLYEYIGDKLQQIYVMGPVFTTKVSYVRIGEMLDEREISAKLKKLVLDRFRSIPVIASTLFFQYAIMMHYAISGKRITTADLKFFECEEISDRILSLREETHNGAWLAEQKLIRNVEEGNLDYYHDLHSASLVSYGVKVETESTIRQAQLSVYTFITLCTQAAIRGGLSPEAAYTIKDYYFHKIENSRHFNQIANISHIMYEDFINRVHKIHSDTNISRPILSCCDYINAHICEKIKIKELADNVNYTEYYLSRKFKKEVGLSLNDYINQQKIEYAKVLLTTSTDSIQLISEQLNFCSRSYFSDVFQKAEGVSPRQYREDTQRL